MAECQELPDKDAIDDVTPEDQTSDDVLSIIQTLMDGEPRTSISVRLGIYHHCAGILAQLGTSDDPLIRSRCSELHSRLRERYPEACGSFHDDCGIPGRETSSLIEIMVDYVREVLQAISDGEGKLWPVGTCVEVSGAATDLLFWMYDNESAGACELLQRFQTLQSACDAIPGFQMPSDEVRSEAEDEGEGSESGSEESERSVEEEGGAREQCAGKDSGEQAGGAVGGEVESMEDDK